MQLVFDSLPDIDEQLDVSVQAAVNKLAEQELSESNGSVYTRTEVVDFILDLAGYTPDVDLCNKRLLEPSFGHGEFLCAAVSRLLDAWYAKAGRGDAVADLKDAILAVELHGNTFKEGRGKLIQLLESRNISPDKAEVLASHWLVQGDFLLESIEYPFDFVVGNPPYVRQELIPSALIAEYRRRYQTIYDRADLYIPFIERSLSLLKDEGTLGFICADRWMKNRYGGRLRKIIAEEFHLKSYVDMTGTPAFTSDVVAYPAITVISREPAGRTRIAHRPAIDKEVLAKLAKAINSADIKNDSSAVREMSGVAQGEDPWLLELPDQMALIRRLEQDYPDIETAGCRVGIGVATGADKAFIGQYAELDVEESRKLPLATTRDLVSGEIKWSGLGVINPYGDDGKLVNLDDYPQFAAYLNQHKEVIARRHCARKNQSGWYKTIDRIVPSLAERPKLLIPDIKGEAHVVYEKGELYPHHNLYYITSSEWDLRALQAVLLSEVTRLFIATYSTKMRGGYLRFQAQYLRRIRLPRWADVPENLRTELSEAGRSLDAEACNHATFKLYGLTHDERSALGGNGA
jgi:hypothetical protein